MRVRITRLSKEIKLPQYQTAGAVAFDIAASETLAISPQSIARIPTGLIIATPPGYALIIALRSSTPVKKGLNMPHGIGIIDQDFAGPADELKIQVYNFTDKEVIVEKGERIVQALFIPIERAEWEEAPPEEKSRGGFGSTGQN